MLDHMEYTYSAEAADAETYSSTTPESSSIMRKQKKKIKNMNTRRFSDEQIKSLESIFETESRLEPRKKLQLARELGLQPRQVAIWFQNKRARWKSKQLERDYSILRNSYNSLNSKFESLKKERQALLIQLQKLNDLIQKPLDQAQSHTTQAKAENSNNMDSESENGDTRRSDEPDLKPRTSSIMQRSATEHNHHHHVVLGALSDDDTSIKVEYFNNMGDDEPGLLNFSEHGGDGSLTSPEDWGTFDSDDILGQSTSDYQLWDFWS